MNIDKLETDGKISKVKLLHDCAGTLRTAAALKNSLDKSAASVTKKHQHCKMHSSRICRAQM